MDKKRKEEETRKDRRGNFARRVSRSMGTSVVQVPVGQTEVTRTNTHKHTYTEKERDTSVLIHIHTHIYVY